MNALSGRRSTGEEIHPPASPLRAYSLTSAGGRACGPREGETAPALGLVPFNARGAAFNCRNRGLPVHPAESPVTALEGVSGIKHTWSPDLTSPLLRSPVLRNKAVFGAHPPAKLRARVGEPWPGGRPGAQEDQWLEVEGPVSHQRGQATAGPTTHRWRGSPAFASLAAHPS